MTLAERFHALFPGLTRAHGKYTMTGKTSKKGKREGYGNTIQGPATADLWEKHLEGEYGLGVVPIRDDDSARWGAIDIDKYDKDIRLLAEQVAALELPLVVCRSKSGGAHLFLFVRDDDIPASLIRSRLMEWAIVIGHSGVEVFPKQISLAGPEDVGNWINMPYYEGDKTDRFAVFNGKKLSAKEFLDVAGMIATTGDVLEDFEIQIPSGVKDLFEEAPPCLQTLAVQGFEEGGRNNALFDIGVYLRKRYGDDWEERLDEYNSTFMQPPLASKEVQQIVKHLKKKTYFYRCNEGPINAVCNKQICYTRVHGIGNPPGDPGVIFGTLVKVDTEPPTWIWDVNGARISLMTQELKDQARFHARAMESINMWPMPVKPGEWQKIVREALSKVEVIEAPPEASRDGQMMIHLENFLSRQPARHREELLMNKPWHNEGRSYFTVSEFQKYLSQQRFYTNEREIWNWLRDRDAEHHFFNMKGRGLNCWSIPSFSAQSEDFETPSILNEEEEL